MKSWRDKEAFKVRVYEWAARLDIRVHVISLRAMKNKWASYTKKSDLLIFNTELLAIDRSLGEYVIVHELLHFRVPNHGKLWKTYMSAYLPAWEDLDRRLKQVAGREM